MRKQNKVVSLNKEGSAISTVAALSEHIDDIEKIVVCVQWKPDEDNTKYTKTYRSTMSIGDLAWMRACLDEDLRRAIFHESSTD